MADDSKQNDSIQKTRARRADKEGRWFGIINPNWIALVFLSIAFGVSLIKVMAVAWTRHKEESVKKVIHIAHWQLEPGFRDAMQHAIQQYEKLHPTVKIEQMPMSSRVYGQWLNTRLVQGDAPDLAKVGMFSSMAKDPAYVGRYFQPVGDLVNDPNPYNKGTDLEFVPWKDTFIDGMQQVYKPELADYYGIPTAAGTIRFFYNKGLFRKVFGSDAPPRTLGEMMRMSREIEQKLGVRAISGSNWSAQSFIWKYQGAFTAGYEDQLDVDLSGEVTPFEAYNAYRQKRVGFDSPEMRSLYDMFFEVTRYFPPSFNAMDPDAAKRQFINQRSAMISLGAWDAAGLLHAADFEIGVFDFPPLIKGEKWAEFYFGRPNEAKNGAGSEYGVYRFGKNKDVALDFLKFLTSKKVNEEFNRTTKWLPVIVGAKPAEEIKEFMPDPTGVGSTVNLYLPGNPDSKITGQQWRFLNEEINYDQFVKAAHQVLDDPHNGGDQSWWNDWDKRRREAQTKDRILTALALELHLGKQGQKDGEILALTPAERKAELQRKYAVTLLQQVQMNNAAMDDVRFKDVRGKSFWDR
jgi:raffinose/stachyose/melibiose transport system substrate-binding protein